MTPYHALDLRLVTANGLLKFGQELLVDLVLRAHEGAELDQLTREHVRFLR